jgi:hypothetical protein
MKQLLYITFVIASLTGFSQEKGPICSSHCRLYHPTENIYNDYYRLKGNNWNLHEFTGLFQPDSIDSTITEITLIVGDSLLYSAGWTDWGPCFYPDLQLEDVEHVITVLEGEVSVTAVREESFSPDWDYTINQEATIRSSCFLELKGAHFSNPKSHFVRVKFQDPPQPETPLSLPEITNDISMWVKNENTLTVKADQDVIWEINLYALSGQMIQKHALEGSQDLDISTLPKGCYVAHISSENGLKKQLKFIR